MTVYRFWANQDLIDLQWEFYRDLAVCFLNKRTSVVGARYQVKRSGTQLTLILGPNDSEVADAFSGVTSATRELSDVFAFYFKGFKGNSQALINLVDVYGHLDNLPLMQAHLGRCLSDPVLQPALFQMKELTAKDLWSGFLYVQGVSSIELDLEHELGHFLLNADFKWRPWIDIKPSVQSFVSQVSFDPNDTFANGRKNYQALEAVYKKYPKIPSGLSSNRKGEVHEHLLIHLFESKLVEKKNQIGERLFGKIPIRVLEEDDYLSLRGRDVSGFIKEIKGKIVTRSGGSVSKLLDSCSDDIFLKLLGKFISDLDDKVDFSRFK